MTNIIQSLNGIKNEGCKRCSSQKERLEATEEHLCKDTMGKDNLPVRCIGSWGMEKIHFLRRYFDIFSNGMKNKWKNQLAYFEFGSGPGRCIIREDGDEIDGSPLAIMNLKGSSNIKNAVFFDINDTVVYALTERLKNYEKAYVHKLDYTNQQEILKYLSRYKSRLHLAFIDPTDCSFPFESISTIKRVCGKCDLIINVAVFTDFNRNIKNIMRQDSSTRHKYEIFLGKKGFFKNNQKIQQLLKKEELMAIRNIFIEEYKNNLRALGYEYFDCYEIKKDNKIPLYYLLFASENAVGLNFWEKATEKSYDGQDKLKFE